MGLAFREKRYLKIRFWFRVITLACNMCGLFLALHLEWMLLQIHKNSEVATEIRTMLKGNGYFEQEFQAVVKVGQIILLVLVLGLLLSIYFLLCHEVSNRKSIWKLQQALGYKRKEIFQYEMAYEFWDVLAAYILSAAVFLIARMCILHQQKMQQLFQRLSWTIFVDVFVAGLIFILLLMINLLSSIRYFKEMKYKRGN